MKSTAEQLENRGYLSNKLNEQFGNKSFEELIELLESPIATERTLSARILSKFKDVKTIDFLIKAFKQEKKLYTKIEISNSLESFGILAVPQLINLLGKIGKNQHKAIAKEKFKKSSYPLPRDIASRTLIRIGKISLPGLIDTLASKNEEQVSEAIDAIGYICFYDNQDQYIIDLIRLYNNTNNDLLKWKIIRAMSGFSESINFLEQEFQRTHNQDLKSEITRILELIKKKKAVQKNVF